MRYSDSQLQGVPVFTESGEHVGRLSGFTVDSATHEIVQYAVRKSSKLHALLPQKFLVNSRQVVELTDEKVIVKDMAVVENEGAEIKVAEPSAKPAGLHSASE